MTHQYHAGNKGIFEDYPPSIYFDGMTKVSDGVRLAKWKEHEHPLWRKKGELAKKVGGLRWHGEL